MRRVYLLDATNLLYRAYHALRGFRTAGGMPTHAAFGLLSMIFRLQREEKPDAVVAVFDPPGPTRKHALDESYKANRERAPDDLLVQIPYVHRAVKALGIPVVIVPGVEADDVIGTLAAREKERGNEVTVVTGDKDFCQLVGPGVRLLDTMSDRETVAGNVADRMGVPADKVVDLLALMGDKVDNLPGVPGLGPKGAAKLLGEYGSLEGVLAHAGEVSGKRGEALRASIERVRANVPLVTIETDLDLPLAEKDLALRPRDAGALAAVLRELEFHKFLKDLGLEGEEAAPAVPPPPPPSAPPPAAKKEGKRGQQSLFPEMPHETEPFVTTTAAGCWTSAVASPAGDGLWGLAAGGKGEAGPPERLRERLRKADKVAGHNLKESWPRWEALGLDPERIVFDTELAAYLLSPGRRAYALADIARERGLGEIGSAPGEGTAARAAEACLALSAKMATEVEERGMGALLREIELPLIPVLAGMERAGVRVDREKLEGLGEEFAGRIAEIEKKMFEAAGEEFNPRSPKDLSRLLFGTLKLKPVRKTATGFSTDAAVLEELAAEHPLPALLLDHRALSKLKSGFIDSLPKLVDPADGRIHASFNQTVAATGRLSSSNPNLQNIPVRGVEGRRIREAFIAEPGFVLLSADYSQIELRVLAHLSGDAVLKEVFSSGRDIHSETAARLFDVGPLAVTTEMRRQAKTVNFGILYGISPFGLARQLGVGAAAAKRMIDTYFRRFPGVSVFIERLIEEAKSTGECRTLFGRVRAVPELESRNRNIRQLGERLAVNTPIQGTAADLIKRAMIRAVARVHQEKLDARLILQVHDELVFEVREGQAEKCRELVLGAMEGAATLDVALKAEAGYGRDWYAAHGG